MLDRGNRHAGLRESGRGPLHRGLPRYWSIRFQLASLECVFLEQYHWVISTYSILWAFFANVHSQWKRAVTAAAVSACNGFGGVAGSYLFRQTEAPRYPTAIWVSIG